MLESQSKALKTQILT